MDAIRREQVRELVDFRARPCLSLFMPVHRAGSRESQQDPVRLKNLLWEAELRLRKADFTGTKLQDLLGPVEAIVDNEGFWQHRSDGVACFIAPGFFEIFKVPLELEEKLTIDDHFTVRPLLPLLRSDSRLFILTLRKDEAQLFESTRYSLHELELPEIPKAVKTGQEGALQFHTHHMPTAGPSSGGEAIFHGQGGPADEDKANTMDFFRFVDRAVQRVLAGERAPLVLACVDYLASMYRSTNSYPNLLEGNFSGSPEHVSEDDLRRGAWQAAEPYFRQTQEQAWQKFEDAHGDQRASEDLPRIVLAAEQHRIDTLFLVRGEQRWGRIESEHQRVEVDENGGGSEDLLEFAAAQTIGGNGDVFVLDFLPDGTSPAAATFRF